MYLFLYTPELITEFGQTVCTDVNESDEAEKHSSSKSQGDSSSGDEKVSDGDFATGDDTSYEDESCGIDIPDMPFGMDKVFKTGFVSYKHFWVA